MNVVERKIASVDFAFALAEGEITLLAWKVLDGRPLEADEFSFRLLDEVGRPVGTVKTNAEDGGISFDTLHYTEEDVGKTFYYFAQELPGDDPTVVYTDAVYGYYVTVVDNNDGTLSFEQGFVDASDRFVVCPACGGENSENCADCGGAGKIWNTNWAACTMWLMVPDLRRSGEAGPVMF